MTSILKTDKIQASHGTAMTITSGHTLTGDTLKGGEVHIDTLKGKTTAASIAVQGEGSATMNLQQGLTKHWVYINQVANSLPDSFNISSLTDHATGKHSVTITSAYGNTDYICVCNGNCYSGSSWNQSFILAKMNWASTTSTTNHDYVSYQDNAAYVDGDKNYIMGSGDLA